MDNWPVSLQQKLNVESFEKKMGKTTLRTEMDVGPAKVRSRYNDAIDLYTCSILLDFDEVSTFETFYKTTLGNGSLPFLFDDPFTEAPAIFRFTDDPSLRPLGGRTYQLAMQWEKLGDA